MTVQGTPHVWPNYSSVNTSVAKEGGNVLGKDDFLKILVAQLRHQDPTAPLQDREFIAQMAQFTSVEQIMNIAEEMKLLRQSMTISSDLIGKQVSWLGMNSTGSGLETHSGVVEAITLRDGNQYAVVGEKEVPIENLIKIWVGGEEQ